MPLIQCPDCDRKISDLAVSCPQCGRPNASYAGPAPDPLRPPASQRPLRASEERLLLEVHPSRWQFFVYYATFILILPPLVAMWKRAAFTLRVYTNRVVIQNGLLSRDIKEIFCTDVRSIEVKQGFFQRLVGIGDIVIGNSASDLEEWALGIPDPTGIKDLILKQKRGAPGSPP